MSGTVEMERRRETSHHDEEGGGGGTIKGGDVANGGHHYGGGVRGKPRRWTTWLVPVVGVAYVAVFVVTMFENNCPSESGKCVATSLRRFSFQPVRENPLYGPSARTLEKMGALQRHKIVDQHQGWRLISCIALHAGVIHLGVCVLSLLFIGIRLERQFGFVRVGIIYLVSGFGGSVLSALFSANRITVGASGALFGLLGAMLSEIITNWTIYYNKVAALLTLVVVIAINSAVGIAPHVDNFHHIGGLVTGFFLGFILLLRPQFRWMERHNLPPQAQVKSKYKPYQILLWVLALCLLVACLAVGLVMLFEGKNWYHRCHRWCRYLSCVPTSSWECRD